MKGTKLILGIIIYIVLIIGTAIGSSIENRWFVFGLWLTTAIIVIVLNNFVCRRMLSFDKLRTYQYSWRQFGIILLLSFGYYRSLPSAKSYSEILRLACPLFIFLGYLVFYLSEKFVRNRILNIALKAVPFLILALVVIYPVISTQLIKPESESYVDIITGERYEISDDDFSTWVSVMSELAKINQNISYYQEIMTQNSKLSTDYQTLIRETSKLEDSSLAGLDRAQGLIEKLESTLLKNLFFDRVSIYRDWISGLDKIKQGTANGDSNAVASGLNMIRTGYLKQLQSLKKYASLVRVKPGGEIEDQKRVALVRIEVAQMSMSLFDYELALVSYTTSDMHSSEFEQQIYHYEAVLKASFQKCDSLLATVANRNLLSIYGELLGSGNMYRSVMYQTYEELSSSVRAYMAGNLEMSNNHYSKFISLRNKVNDIVNKDLSIYIQ
jgi:hypothetical protein